MDRKKYYRAKRGLISQIYSGQKKSSIKRGHPPPEYTCEELFEFAVSSEVFNTIYKQWVESGYQKNLSPTFDRKDDYSGYSFSNFNKWMTLSQNRIKYGQDCIRGINNKNSKPVICINIINGNIRDFYSISNASRATGVAIQNISACCKGKIKRAGMFKWEFKNKKEENERS